MPINRLTTGTLSVPATVNAGDTVTFILTGANGAPIANEAVTVTNPSRMTTDYTTNASGQASFVASAEGQYNYMVAGMVLNKSVSTSANALVKPGTGGTQPPAANQSGGTPVAPVPTTDFGPLGILLLAAIAIVVIVGGYLVFVKSMKQKKSDDEDSQNNRKKQSGK